MELFNEIALEVGVVLLVCLCAVVSRVYLWQKDLWRWHSLTDDEGVKVWYVRKSLEDSIHKLVEVVERLDRRDAEHVAVLKSLSASLGKLAEKL